MLEEPTKEPEPKAAEPAEPSPAEPAEPGEAHPLEPGGKRFEQVYAEKKDLERRLQEQQAELQRLQAEQHKAAQATAAKPKEYTDDELDSLEEDALARGDRQTVRQVREYRTERTARRVLEQTQAAAGRAQLHQTVRAGLMESFPDLADQNSDLFKASAAEFTLLTQEYSVKGLDISADPHATELAVGRALRKHPKLFVEKTMAKPKQAEPADTHTGTEEGGKPAAPEKGTKLTSRELDFARRSGMDPKEYAKWKVQRQARG